MQADIQWTVHTHISCFDFHNFCYDFVKKVTVVGYDKYSARVIQKGPS